MYIPWAILVKSYKILALVYPVAEEVSEVCLLRSIVLFLFAALHVHAFGGPLDDVRALYNAHGPAHEISLLQYRTCRKATDKRPY